MENPRVSDTWKRAATGAREVSTVGANLTPSMINRFGNETCETEIAWLPVAAGAMMPVSCEVAAVEPLLFVAVTLTRSTLATSAEAAV